MPAEAQVSVIPVDFGMPLAQLERTRVTDIHRQKLQTSFRMFRTWCRGVGEVWRPDDATVCDDQLVRFIRGLCRR